MNQYSRRDFVKLTAAGGLVLGASVLPTPGSGGLGAYANFLEQEEKLAIKPPANWDVTEDNILGPFHRAGAPFRAKIGQPFEPGTVLVVKGRVWGHDTKKPLAFATIDIW
ncbi:MAG: twin-arginine translocation signal domain-containing protein, partial [Gemmataceae bacterium]